MHMKDKQSKGVGKALKAMGMAQKVAVSVAALVVVGGIVAITVAALNKSPNDDKPVIAPSDVTSVEPSSTPSSTPSSEPSSEPSSDDISSEESSKPVSSTKTSSTATSSTPKTSSTATAPVSSSAPPSQTAVAQLPEGYQERFADLYAANKDFVGWIKFTGKLDYPVVRTSASSSYYLDHTFYKKSSAWGTPYMWDYVTIGASKNTTVWSHSNPKTGEMFQALKGLRKVDFYKQHPTIQFDDVYGDGTYKIIAFFVENTKSENQSFHYQDFINQTDEAYINDFMTQAKARSFINTTVDWTADDQFLTLSTCWDTNSANWDRLVTVARKVRPGEDASVDTSGATQNDAQQLPPGGLFSPKY